MGWGRGFDSWHLVAEGLIKRGPLPADALFLPLGERFESVLFVAFQRADVAPKSTSGDGQLKVNDWVQAGRYGAVIDAPVAVGGPTAPVAPTTLTGGPRAVSMAGGTGVKGLNVTMPVVLQ